jgi:CRISPR/Cas system CMR subunit Cmr6 (Cas7 group RAMP superfamily)
MPLPTSDLLKRRESIKVMYPHGVPPPHSNTPPASVGVNVHYSFDMAQQVHYPSDPLQPGPIYFLTPRKCAVFGICCEAIPRQGLLFDR